MGFKGLRSAPADCVRAVENFDFARTHNPKVVGSHPTPATIYLFMKVRRPKRVAPGPSALRNSLSPTRLRQCYFAA
jgi:hypothetical protein